MKKHPAPRTPHNRHDTFDGADLAIVAVIAAALLLAALITRGQKGTAATPPAICETCGQPLDGTDRPCVPEGQQPEPVFTNH
jgi:hypothetical protein